MSSQRHRIVEQGATSNGEIHAQGVVAPGMMMQVNPENIGEVQLVVLPGGTTSNVEVPIGAPGGPLSGSSLTGAIPIELEPPPEPEPIPEPGPDPLPGEEPVLNSINPSSARLGSADLTMNVNGNRFTDTSIIYFNGGAEPTTFNNAGQVSTIVKPSTATIAGSFPVWVQQGSFQTGAKDFTFLDPQIDHALPEMPAGQRAFPLGPFNIVRVDDDVEGLSLELVEGDVRVGDTVTIEATGSSSVNGNYTVLSADNGVIVFDSDFALTTPIEGKGRLTVTGGAA
jgi:hypothetical protein